MFKLYSKLKAVKKILKVKNLEIFGGLRKKVNKAKNELDLAQSAFIASHEENFLKQKARNNWLNLGNGNTPFFHKSVKLRNSANLVKVLKDDEGNRVEDWEQIKAMAVDRITKLITRKFSSACVGGMAADVTKEEIRKVVFSLNKNKAPGPDGFSAGFFQRAWPIVGEDVIEAILDFFSLMVSSLERLLKGLDDIVGPNQGAFIPGRSIAENILLAQELCSGAPRKFIGWIQECISSPSYSVALNGSLVGYFPSQKGLRHGDPMSPYLFVITMEVLSLLLEEATADPQFGSKQDVLNLLQMSEGTLHVLYLGVPLITKRLSAVDCDSLVNKITTRINSCFHVFWSRVFILPKKVVKLIEQKLNRFLWSGKDSRANAKVAWDKICTPKKEGGLDGCLFDKFGYRVIYDAGRNIGPRVSSIIRDGE
ncbi:uncharacterized protein LOC133873388 [Alnus glutinosa]|uniref:uncharacterized protein LOC133873388 n=1 Tax=Alnus glutinosa TaxID=3517 RepID=UPI002D7669BB|nr:uncharacterized protein LOC133873388 [Alnus glutinosa]